MEGQRPVWAEINLENIRHNYKEVRRLVGPTVKVMAVVKANAYGHGALQVAKTLGREGADGFAVAIMNEAVELRQGGITKPILILGWTPEADYERALQHDITLAIFSLQEAQKLSRIATREKKTALVHLKIDTGMGRIGFQTNGHYLAQIEKILDLSGLAVEGIFTHLAKADERDKTYTGEQLNKFKDFVSQIEKKTGHIFKIKHAANSAAIIDYPEAYFDMVRPGIILYGLKPSDEVHLERLDLRQVFSLRAKIAYVKEVPPQTAISYGGRYVTDSAAIIATLPIGYADGYSRLLSGKVQGICRGQRVPLVGRICMDQCMVNVTNIEPILKQGEKLTLIGHDGKEFISVDELAEILGTINYEVTCMISERVPRIYL